MLRFRLAHAEMARRSDLPVRYRLGNLKLARCNYSTKIQGPSYTHSKAAR